VTVVTGYFTDLSVPKKIFKGSNRIFHEGAIASVFRSIAYPLATNEANVTGMLNSLIADRDREVRESPVCFLVIILQNTLTFPKREDMTPNPLFPNAASEFTGGDQPEDVF